MAENKISAKEVVTYGGAIFALFAMYKIAEKFGFIKSDAEQQQQQNLQNLQTGGGSTVLGSFWNPNFWQNVAKKYGTATTIGKNVADNLAYNIWDAIAWWGDSETQIYAVFRALQYQSQISYLAQVFQAKYDKDLYGFLQDHLSDDELNNIAVIIQNYPITSKAKQ